MTPRTLKIRNKRRLILYLFILILTVLTLFPYFVMVISSLKDSSEMYGNNLLVFPVEAKWQNYADIFQFSHMEEYIHSSMIIAFGSVLLSVCTVIPASYALARMHFRGKKAFLAAVMMVQTFAPVVLLVGIYRLMTALSLTDSLLGLIILNAAFNQAFSIWLLTGAFRGLPSDMEQAAAIDGCNQFTAMLRILLPMAMPAISMTMIFVFINSWNEYTMAMTLISTDSLKPITVGINVFFGYTSVEWPYVFATSLVATIPVIILFLCIEKNFVEGLAAGGVKG